MIPVLAYSSIDFYWDQRLIFFPFVCFNSEVTYPIHVEAINTLLVMLSVQMFDSGASHSSIFYQVIMKGKW